LTPSEAAKELGGHEPYDVSKTFDGLIGAVVLEHPVRLLRLDATPSNPDPTWFTCCLEPIRSEIGAPAASLDATGLALLPSNTRDTLTMVEVPAGSAVYFGKVADLPLADNVILPGGGVQVYVRRAPPSALSGKSVPQPAVVHRYRRRPANAAPSGSQSPKPFPASVKVKVQPATAHGIEEVWFDQISWLWRPEPGPSTPSRWAA